MERIDDLQFNGLKMIQDTELFCFGCDAVELANFAAGQKGKTVCDLGAGNGIISVLLAGKFGMRVTAVEIQAPCASLVKRNAELNNLTDLIESVNLPMQEYVQKNRGKTFDFVVCNPPYRKTGSGERQLLQAVERARHELDVTLSEVVFCAASLLSTGGKFFMIHQTQRLSEAICLCKAARLEAKVLQVLRPSENKPPHLFLLQCTKDGKEGLNVLPERSVKTYGIC